MEWLNHLWPALKKELVQLTTKEVFRNGHIIFNAVSINDVSNEVISIVYLKTSSDASGKWDTALSLLGEFPVFLSCFSKENENSITSDKIQNYFGEAFKQYLEYQRRELVALELNDEWSPSKIKTWERLQRISTKVAERTNIDARCSEKHFQDVLQWINTQYRHNYNYPHKLSTIRTYFYKMSTTCKEVINLGYDIDEYTAGGKIDVLAEILLGESEKSILFDSLKDLDDNEYELLNIEFKLELKNIFSKTKKEFCLKHSLSNHEYIFMKESALNNLADIFHKRYQWQSLGA